MKTLITKKYFPLLCTILVFLILMIACAIDEFYFSEDHEYEREVNAGDVLTFNVIGDVWNGSGDPKVVAAVMGILVPKSWKGAENITITYIKKWVEDPVVANMKLVSETAIPKNHSLPWSQALYKEYRIGPNILDDMEWIVFETNSDPMENGERGLIDFTVKIKTGDESLRAKIVFYLNHTDDGLSGDQTHFKMINTDCIEVKGEGDRIDFCEPQANTVLPSNATQDDLITFTFLPRLEEEGNDLYDETELYLCATAITINGNVYNRLERNTNSMLLLENIENDTYSLTCWPKDYFGIPENETIDRIEYYFSNKEGDKVFNYMEEDGSTRSFNFSISCK